MSASIKIESNSESLTERTDQPQFISCLIAQFSPQSNLERRLLLRVDTKRWAARANKRKGLI